MNKKKVFIIVTLSLILIAIGTLKRYKLLYYLHDKDGKKENTPFMKNI